MKVFTIPGLPSLLIFKKVLFFLDIEKTETQLFLYQHLCPCVLSSVLMQLPSFFSFTSEVCLQPFRYSKAPLNWSRGYRKYNSINFKVILKGPGPPVPLPCLRQWTNSLTFKEPRVLLLLLNKSAIGPYLEQDLSHLQHHNPHLSNPFYYYPPIYVAPSLKSFSLRFSH